jgi:alkanesulfonate monooxygenase SsuD/methylene tetrahydromethanopterin reductase-like flavin-dependent oxidoreductase (luciferase family)
VKFGYFNQFQMPKPWPGEDAEVNLYRNAMEQAIHAEAVGFHSYWQTEHHFYTEIGHSSAPEVFLAALAQHTKTIRLGLGVVVLPCNHPFRVAEQIATLDQVSNGRVEFGTGRGASNYHIEAFGISPEESREVWEESLQVICSLFLNDKFPGHRGKYYDLPARSLVPKPIQKPHPPIWVAATQPSTFETAARMGLGVLGLTTISPEDLIPAVQAYRAAEKDCRPVGGFANHQVSAY